MAYLDSCCLIYLIEEVPSFSEQMLNHLVSNQDMILCVSPLVRLEVLVKPLTENNNQLVADYEDFLFAQQWLSMNDAIFEKATNLRSKHKIKTPDAIHLATAIYYNCNEFWTNDERLKNIVGDMAVNLFTAQS